MSSILSVKDSIAITTGFSKLPDFTEVNSKQVKKVAGRKVDNSVNNLFLCHATPFFPKNGTILPRMKFDMGVDHPLKTILERVFPILRPTVHFTVNSVVSNHRDYIAETNRRFIVVDSFERAAESISGGYIEDVFCIGPYHLSNQAEVLIPESCRTDQTLQKEIAALKGRVKIVYYQGNEGEALAKWMKEKNASILTPVQKDPDAENFICTFGRDRYLSSVSLMEKAKKTFCSHAATPMAQIENLIGTSPVCDQAPFLQVLIGDANSYESLSNRTKEYIQAIEKSFNLTENQKSFIRSYEKAVLLALKIFSKAENLDELHEEFNIYKELILQYDAKVDLNRRIDGQRPTQDLSKITGLPFVAYYRLNCKTVVDAGYPTGLSKKQSEELVRGLTKKTDLEFILEEHEDKFYIVLKRVNLPEVQSKLSTH